MANTELARLAALIRSEAGALLDTWRAHVRLLPSAQGLDVPTLNDHVPGLIRELSAALIEDSGESIVEALVEGSPPAHGLQRLQDGFDLEEVVAEYNILRGCVHDLAQAHGLALQGEPFHVLNRILDGAIGSAVQAYATQRAQEVQLRREEYLAFVAHDLRTPLNAIALAMNFLERASAAGEPTGDKVMWRILRRNVQQLESLVGKVMKENVNIEAEAGFKLTQRTVDLWPLVENARMDLLPIAEAHSTRVVNSVPEDMLVFGDAGMVRRILQNLLRNAIDYAPGGVVTVSAQGGQTAEGMIECYVEDDGAGIPAHRLAAVFDKMETDPAASEGSRTGLGLAIVKAFVEAHGGSVTVTSVEGTGTRFRFTLPEAPAANVPA